MAPWRKGRSPYYLQTIESISKHYGFDQKLSWGKLDQKIKDIFLRGSGDEEIEFRYDEGGRVYNLSRSFEGVIPNMDRRYKATDSSWVKEEFERYQNNRPCVTCSGFRLKPEALAVRIGDLHVGNVVRMSIKEASAWVEEIPRKLSNQGNETVSYTHLRAHET